MVRSRSQKKAGQLYLPRQWICNMKHRMKICMRFYRGQGHQFALAPRTPKAPLPPSHLLCLAVDDDQVSTLLSTVTHSARVQLQQPGIQPEGMSGVGKKLRQPLSLFGLPVYFKLMILFYTFTKALGQRFDIFSSH